MERATLAPKPPSLLPLIIHQLKLKQKRQQHRNPNIPSKASLIRCHGNNLNLHETQQLHAHAIVTNFDHASQTIPEILLRRITSPESQHNFLITSYNRNDSPKTSLAIYAHLRRTGVEVDAFTVPSILKSCGECSSLDLGREVHGYAIKTGIDRDLFVRNALMKMYSECGSLAFARRLFEEMTERDCASWNTVIQCCVRSRLLEEALWYARTMLASGIMPDEPAMIGMVGLSVALGDAAMGKAMHGYVVRHGMLGEKIGTCLIDMYGKCGNSGYASGIFNGKLDSEESVVAWTVMITGFIRCNQMGKAMELFGEMVKRGVTPNEITLLSLVSRCGFSSALHAGTRLHNYIEANDLAVSPALATAIVKMYVKCGDLVNARKFFDHRSDRDSGIWGAMISAYVRADRKDEALSLFADMVGEGTRINPATIGSLIALCAEIGSLELGKWVHSQINEQGLEVDLVVKTSLLNMYAKCGDLGEAQRLFNEATEKDTCMWNAMMTGLAMHGSGDDALELFAEMENLGVKPNRITFVAVLNACSHAGQVSRGKSLFDKMVNCYGLVPGIEHYGCMVDILGRDGKLSEAREFIDAMPIKPNTVVWGSLLASCKVHNAPDHAEAAAEKIAELEPGNRSYDVLMSNVYAKAERWNDVAGMRTGVKESSVGKPTGLSSIEIDGSIHGFVAGDKTHARSGEIYEKLTEMSGKLKEVGYVPNTSGVFQNLEEEDKEAVIRYHSEKLAIAFGLIGSAPGATIRIVKNLRVCEDCHEVTKLLSKIYERTIIVRDRKRFHHFTDGSCSCGDYW